MKALTTITLGLALMVSLSISTADAQQRMLTGTPNYATPETEKIIKEMVAAHGGTEPWQATDAMSFSFITKVVGNGSRPFYSVETTNLKSGAAYLHYPFLNADIAWDTKEVWSKNWPMPLPPGFFAGLTTSFLTLPWLTQNEGVTLAAPRPGHLPKDEKLYTVVRMTQDQPGPTIPGDFYDLYIDRESKLLTGIGFNITHPFMVRAFGQPAGPNYHKFMEYQTVNTLVIPTYYETHGYNAPSGQTVFATHMVFDVNLRAQFDEARLAKTPEAVVDESTTQWWAR